ncbi:MAG: flagellar biosynthetic protein FliR [Deltaproteobacteria bacterium]|nr:flagellar biosynthetic protein FliR [Deltaproteobacteria bacterium]MBN2673069.1 flagellar biosynthetic protein FliR [Deltaproteobacteria bacterium]
MPFFLDTELLLPLALSIAMIMTRLAFLFLAAPAFGAQVLPRNIGIAIVFVLSIAVYAGLPEVTILSLKPIDLVIAAFGEAALGAAAGLTARIVFSAAETAGQVMGVPMGLGFSQSVDPLTDSQSVVTSRFLGIIVAMLFFALDIHLVLIKYVVESFKILGPGEVVFDGQVGLLLARKGAMMFSSAIQLAAPVLVVLMGIMVSLGILARIAPKVNLFVLSFAVSIGVGLLALKAAIPNIVAYTRGLVLSIEPFVSEVLRSF